MSFKNRKKVVVLNYDINDNKKKKSKKIYLLSFIVLLIITAVWGVISLSTTENFISTKTKKILSKAGIYTKPVENTITKSNIDDGNWTITKNANWTSSSTARVTIDLESDVIPNKINKDIIFVVDTSESMTGSKLDRVKDETINVLDQLLENSSNRVAIITFNNDAQVISDFTSDKEVLTERINSIQTSTNTNYYAGLKSIYSVLKNYSKDSDNELLTIFITDGKPNKSTPNEKNIYKALKEKYSYMDIYGIQYEMNLTKPVKELKNITDEQWIANQGNIKEVLKEVLSFSDKYKEMVITDYINTKYFKITNEKDIKATIGNIKLEDENDLQKLTWDLNDKYATGSKQTITFDVTLKDNYHDQAGLYPIIKNENIKYSINENNDNITDYETPVLNTKYDVIYDVNSPKECNIKKIDSDEQLIYQNVNINNEQLSCDSYIFKGWEIVENDVTNINDNVFVMPGHDVTVRAIWAKPQLNLSMDGQVYQSSKIYKVLEDAANNNSYVTKYNGNHKDTVSGLINDKAIYYYNDESSNNNYTINEKNNVLFANHCWKLIRTTDNGGVRLLYNGEPDENDQCGTDRDSHAEIKGINDNATISLDWYYSKNYIYDSANKKFKLNTDITKYDINNYQELVGKYTCGTTTETDNCQTLYYVQSIINQNTAKVVTLVINDTYNQIATSTYNNETDSPAYVGYKYGDVYKQAETSITAQETITNTDIIIKSISIKNKQYLYSDEVSYNNQYVLTNPKTSSKLDDESLKGKYTMFNAENISDNKVYQIIGVDNNNAYYVELTNGIDANNSITIGDSINNTNGLYEINNPQIITLRDWFEKSSEYKGYYVCNSSTNNCNDIKYIIDTTKGSAITINPNNKIVIAKTRNGLVLDDYKYVTYDQIINDNQKLLDEGYKYTCNNLSTTCQSNELRLIISYSKDGYNYVSNRYFGTNVVWNGVNYSLQNIIEMENYNNIQSLDTHRYMCVESGKTECDKVAYIYGYNDNSIYYLLLENGVSDIDTAKDNMFKKNIYDSTAKRIVEAWYELNLKKYSDYIDTDAIYCNNRDDINNNSIKDTLKYKGYELKEKDLDCPNITDQFSYNNEYAKLNYPIALATAQELALTKTNQSEISNSYWTMTPSEFNNKSALMKVFDEKNNYDSNKTNTSLALRPVVTLKENTEFDDGDGTTINPYHINVGEE